MVGDRKTAVASMPRAVTSPGIALRRGRGGPRCVLIGIVGGGDAARQIDARRANGAASETGRVGSARADFEPAERVDEVREARPTEPVLLAVLEPADHCLVDARVGLELPLRPAEPLSALPERSAEELEAALALRIAMALSEPRHTRTLVERAYPGLIRS